MPVLSYVFKGARCHLLVCGHELCIHDTETLCLDSLLHACKTENSSLLAISVCQNYCTGNICWAVSAISKGTSPWLGELKKIMLNSVRMYN